MSELARVEQERTRELKRMQGMQDEMALQEKKQGELGLDQSGERWLIDNFIKALRSDIAISQQRIKNWTIAVEAARQELLKRSKDKKALEKLKENKKEQHDKEEKYREQKEFDETASIRFKASY